MAAAGLADVLVGDPHPAEALRLGDHALEQLAVSLLDVDAGGQLGLGVAQAQRERVAHPLQLGDPEDPGAPGRCDPELDPLTRIGGREKLPEPQLEPGDLAAQVLAGAPLGAAIGYERWKRAPCGACRCMNHLGNHCAEV